jgi:hypothetical protein
VTYTVDGTSAEICELIFVNTYTDPGTGGLETIDGAVTVKKTLEGDPVTGIKTFAFTLEQIDGETITVTPGNTLTMDSDNIPVGGKTFILKGLEYGEMYIFMITETDPGTNWGQLPVSYIVTIRVSAEEGVTYTYGAITDGTECELVFRNTYTAPIIVIPTNEPPPPTNPPPTTDPVTEPTTPAPTTAAPTTTATVTTTAKPTADEITTEPATTTESVTEPMREEPVTSAPATDPAATEPTIPEDTIQPTAIIITAEPAIEETTANEELFVEGDGRVPLYNGWFAVQLEDDMWEIFDANGVPLGTVRLPEGVSIEDYDVEGNLIPLAGIPYEPPMLNPQTGDIIYTGFGLFFMMLACTVIFRKKIFNKVNKTI